MSFEDEFEERLNEELGNENERNREFAIKIAKGLGIAVLAVAGFFLFGFLFMLLWNELMPEIFGLRQINFWQGWGLLILSFILFKGGGASESAGASDRKRKRQLKRYMSEGRQGFEPRSGNYGHGEQVHRDAQAQGGARSEEVGKPTQDQPPRDPDLR